MFPALAIITAKTISDWLGPDKKDRALGIMVGVIAVTILFVNITFFQVKVTLSQSSKEVRELAAVINLNTPKNQTIGNYGLTPSNPRLAMLFYTNRVMESSVISDPEKLMTSLSSTPEKTWLSSIIEYRKLAFQHPDKVYLIQANSKYAFFTSMKNRENIRYDFSAMQLPLIK
jgi:hypothetical protein